MSDGLLKADWERCAWPACLAQAVAAYNNVTVIPETDGYPRQVGRVALCRHHLRTFVKEKRLRLDWGRVA